MPTVAMTVHRRPHYLHQTLESWLRVRGRERWQFQFSVDPSDRTDEVLAVLQEFNFGTVYVNQERQGVARNPWTAMSRAMSQYLDPTEFVVLAEEDIIVSDDILEYFDWSSERFKRDQQVLAVCARSKLADVGLDPASVVLAPHFEVQVWGTWSDRWEQTLQRTWDFDYSTYTGQPGNHAGWDWNIAERIMPMTDTRCVIPLVSRVSHIGLTEGEHTSPETEQADASPTFKAHRSSSIAYRVHDNLI